jgi:hypothetical protein
MTIDMPRIDARRNAELRAVPVHGSTGPVHRSGCAGFRPWYESNVAKTSISIEEGDLRWLRAWARKHHRGNLSAAVAEGTKILRQHENLRKVLDDMGAPLLTDADRARLDREIDGPAVRRRTRRTKRAA